jgi:hypothetical protein
MWPVSPQSDTTSQGKFTNLYHRLRLLL